MLAAAMPIVAAASSQQLRTWKLGGGFVATIYAPQRDPYNPQARRTLVIQKQGHAVRRFSREDEGARRPSRRSDRRPDQGRARARLLRRQWRLRSIQPLWGTWTCRGLAQVRLRRHWDRASLARSAYNMGCCRLFENTRVQGRHSLLLVSLATDPVAVAFGKACTRPHCSRASTAVVMASPAPPRDISLARTKRACGPAFGNVTRSLELRRAA